MLPQLAAVGAIAALFSSVTIEVHRQGEADKKFFDSEIKEKADLDEMRDLADDVWQEVQEAGEEILDAVKEAVEDLLEPEEDPEI